MGPLAISGVVGVMKAYTTRVGGGPFPTEIREKQLSDALREAGHEYGATTGRPRRVGWLDFVALKHAMRVNGCTGLAITKLDVLTGFAPLFVCTAYKIDGKTTTWFPTDAALLSQAEPVYEEIPGWQENDLSNVREPDDLPDSVRRYVARIEMELDCPCILVSVGAKRQETIVKANPFLANPFR